jgi:hypothetical protein
MCRIINGKRYNTETATVIASNEYWDGSNYERGGTNTHLYRSPKGAYFLGYSTCWQGSHSRLTAITKEEAMQQYEALLEHEVEFEEAFPGEIAEDA